MSRTRGGASREPASPGGLLAGTGPDMGLETAYSQTGQGRPLPPLGTKAKQPPGPTGTQPAPASPWSQVSSRHKGDTPPSPPAGEQKEVTSGQGGEDTASQADSWGLRTPRGLQPRPAVPLPEDTSLLQAQQGRRWDGQEPSSLPCCPEDPCPGEARQGSCGGPDSPRQKPPDTYAFMDTEKFVLKKKQSK